MVNKRKKDVEEEKNKKAYERNKKKLEYILGHKDLNMILGRKQQEIVKKGFAVMRKGMDDKAAEKQLVPATGKEKSQVKEALNLVLNRVINAPIIPILRDLALEFRLLAFNWNKSFGKRPDIVQVAQNITAITQGNLSLVQSINIIKSLTERLRNVQRFTPPAFELSKAYLETLQKGGIKDEGKNSAKSRTLSSEGRG